MPSYIWLYFKNAQPDLALKYLNRSLKSEPFTPSNFRFTKILS